MMYTCMYKSPAVNTVLVLVLNYKFQAFNLSYVKLLIGQLGPRGGPIGVCCPGAKNSWRHQEGIIRIRRFTKKNYSVVENKNQAMTQIT